MEDLKIRVKNLYKEFLMETEKNQGALQSILSLFSKKDKKELVAIKNVSFDVYAGQIFGIIGKNGSGKSTLLRVVAGIYSTDKGSVEIFGEPIYLNGFGPGLSPKLTMRENIYLIGSIMDIPNKDMKKKFEEIVEFSGLEDFIDCKVYQFSSGMVARLVFSTAIHCLEYKNPKIILLDEVFEAGGDFKFKEKATKKMEEFIKDKKAVILVSHNLEMIKNYCNNVLWLDHGKIREIGKAEEVVKKYLES
jgi:ABC-type polysaccharide/polyol phosphate transport system ATPase subunit